MPIHRVNRSGIFRPQQPHRAYLVAFCKAFVSLSHRLHLSFVHLKCLRSRSRFHSLNVIRVRARYSILILPFCRCFTQQKSAAHTTDFLRSSLSVDRSNAASFVVHEYNKRWQTHKSNENVKLPIIIVQKIALTLHHPMCSAKTHKLFQTHSKLCCSYLRMMFPG